MLVKVAKFAKRMQMYLEDFVEIIGGKICNTPQISLLNNVSTRLDSIFRGDVFILRNENDIEEAINRGAYGIVAEKFYEISDNEVAFILVENLHNALNKFVKYTKLTSGIEIFSLNRASFNLAKNIARDKNIAFASNIYDLVESLHHRMIFIDFEVLFFETETIKNTRNFLFKILYQTLFELKIEFENNIYELILPSVFMDELNDIVYFFKMRHIDFKINVDESLFLPLFINTSAQLVKYGQSMRFIYATKDLYLLKKYIDFIRNAKWGRTLILSNSKLDFIDDLEIKYYDINDNLLEYFLLEKYHFFVIFGLEQNDITLKADFIEQQLF